LGKRTRLDEQAARAAGREGCFLEEKMGKAGHRKFQVGAAQAAALGFPARQVEAAKRRMVRETRGQRRL